jgi:hypothetical protein
MDAATPALVQSGRLLRQQGRRTHRHESPRRASAVFEHRLIQDAALRRLEIVADATASYRVIVIDLASWAFRHAGSA